MPDILIKNEVGIPVTYEGITSITVPTTDGSTATFNNGIPSHHNRRWRIFNGSSDMSFIHLPLRQGD